MLSYCFSNFFIKIHVFVNNYIKIFFTRNLSISNTRRIHLKEFCLTLKKIFFISCVIFGLTKISEKRGLKFLKYHMI